MTLKYGKITGFWLGPQRAVVIADFDVLQELLNKPETSERHDIPHEVIGKDNSQRTIAACMVAASNYPVK